MNGRESERVIFEIFRQKCGLTGTFVHNKGNSPGDENKPDFVREGGDLGIEITEINVPGKIHGKTLREHEIGKQRIIDRARQKAKEAGLPPLHVGVIFTGDLQKGKEPSVTESLFQIVQRHYPKQMNGEVILDLSCGLPNEFWWIHMRNDGGPEHYWDYSEAGDVVTEFADQLQEKMDAKSRKISKYLRHCGTCWLIIASVVFDK